MYRKRRKHEWELAYEFKKAFAAENYKLCAEIKDEIEKRIADGTIDTQLMEGFRKFNPDTRQFYGKPKYDGLNGLFDNYKSISLP